MSEKEPVDIDETIIEEASSELEDDVDNTVVDLEGIKLNEVTRDDPKTERIAELEQSVEDWRGRAYRSAADLENARKRFQREKDDLKKFGVEGLLKDVLGVIDNLERALEHAEGGSSLVEGVEMVLRRFVNTAAKYGAEPFDAKGAKFDPQLHEAMTQVPTADHEPGTVVDVYQRGWKLHGRLVRPAMVTVAAAPPAAAETTSDAATENTETSNDVDVEG